MEDTSTSLDTLTCLTILTNIYSYPHGRLHHGSAESRKSLEQKSSSKLVLTGINKRFDLTNLFLRMIQSEFRIQSVTQAYSEKENPSFPNRSRTYDFPITSSDALTTELQETRGS